MRGSLIQANAAPGTDNERSTELRTAIRQLMANKEDLERERQISEKRLRELETNSNSYRSLLESVEEERNRARNELQQKFKEMEQVNLNIAKNCRKNR